MEKNIYVKNYKGFREQIISLEDVNFFVGENSTGKTSIIQLISILNSYEFWYSMEFNNNLVEIGYFDEIINKNTEDDFFRIGLETYDNSSKKLFRILLEFKEYKSVPQVQTVKIQGGQSDFVILLKSKETHIKVKDKQEQSFHNWANDFFEEETYKRVNEIDRTIPLLYGLSGILDKFDHGLNITFFPYFNRRYRWLAPIRAKAQRIYESFAVKNTPEGDHIPSLLRELFESSTKKDHKYILNTLSQFGKESNLFDEVSINNFSKANNNSPFEILVKYSDTTVKLTNVGYGVSQSLPLVVELLTSKHSMISIQQPEVHLHPKAQAAFGSLIYNSVSHDGNSFIIETHSDFTINRFRYNLNQNQNQNIKSQVIFFERENNDIKATHLTISENGVYENEIPSNYLDFFIDEELRLLEI